MKQFRSHGKATIRKYGINREIRISFNQFRYKKVIQTKIYILSRFILFFFRVEQFVSDDYAFRRDFSPA